MAQIIKRQNLTMYEYEMISNELSEILRLFSSFTESLRGKSDVDEIFTMRITYHGCERKPIADLEIYYPAQKQ